MESTQEVNPSYASDGKLWCVFFARHPNDKKKSDAFSRWWPEWHRYHRCPSTNDIIFGPRILIRPNITPCSSRFIQWAELLPICCDSSHALLGPFDFTPINPLNRTRNIVPESSWLHLAELCYHLGLQPPTLGPISSHLPPLPSSSTKRKKK